MLSTIFRKIAEIGKEEYFFLPNASPGSTTVQWQRTTGSQQCLPSLPKTHCLSECCRKPPTARTWLANPSLRQPQWNRFSCGRMNHSLSQNPFADAFLNSPKLMARHNPVVHRTLRDKAAQLR